MAKTCTYKFEEKKDDEEGFSDGEYDYFTRKLKIGKEKFKGKLPFLCFGCVEVGHFTKNCSKKSDGN